MFYPVKRTSNGVCTDPFVHIFETFFGENPCARAVESRLAPQFEIAETDDRYTVAAELPGLGKANIEIVVEEDVLTVKGEKKATEKQEGKDSLFSERSYGAFARKFRLPETVEQTAIAAAYENGVLALTLPKKTEAEKPEPRTIRIEG